LLSQSIGDATAVCFGNAVVMMSSSAHLRFERTSMTICSDSTIA
jgi:hypothetical protein